MNFESLKSLHIPEGRVISIAINGVKVFKTKGEVTTAPTPLYLTYDRHYKELVSAGSGTGVMYYSLDNSTWSTSIPTAKDAGNYTVYYYVESTEDYRKSDVGSVECTIIDRTCELILSASEGTITYPSSSLTFTVLENSSGGTLSVASSNDEIATASIDGNIVTVNWVSAGSAIITVTSEETDTYDAASVTFNVTTEKATPTITQNMDSASIDYMESMEYEFSTDSDGEITVTVEPSDIADAFILLENHISISETSGTLVYPTTSLTFTVLENPSGGALSVASSNDEIATASIDGNIITVNWISPGEATITLTSEETDTYEAGTATIHVTVAKGHANLSMATSATTSVGAQTAVEFTTDSDGEPEITVEHTNIALVSLKEFSTVVNPPVPKEDLIYIGEPLELIEEGSGSTAMEYKLNDGAWSTEIPTATEPGTYTVYYRTVATGDHASGTVMSLTVTIVDVPTDEGINLPNTIEIVNNRSVSIPITTDTEGTLTVRSHNDNVITAEITDNNVLGLHAITLGTSLVIVALHDENGTIVSAKKISVRSVESTTYNSYADMTWNDVSLYTWDEM